MNDQQRYFDQKIHRYPDKDVINPPLAQQLEMEALQKALGNSLGQNIVDFGAGSGRVTFWFLQKGYNVTAVDVSQKSLESLQQLYARKKTIGWGKLIVATRLPKQGSVDGVIGADILHHINLQMYVPLFYRVLRPHGRVAFSEPNALYPLWYLFLWSQRLPWTIEKGILACTPWNLKRQLVRVGFKEVSVRGHGLFPSRVFNTMPQLSRLNTLDGASTSLAPFAFRFIVTATKPLSYDVKHKKSHRTL